MTEDGIVLDSPREPDLENDLDTPTLAKNIASDLTFMGSPEPPFVIRSKLSEDLTASDGEIKYGGHDSIVSIDGSYMVTLKQKVNQKAMDLSDHQQAMDSVVGEQGSLIDQEEGSVCSNEDVTAGSSNSSGDNIKIIGLDDEDEDLHSDTLMVEQEQLESDSLEEYQHPHQQPHHQVKS